MNVLSLLLSLIVGTAQAQTANPNPVPGATWQNFGPTLGAGWSAEALGSSAFLSSSNIVHTIPATCDGHLSYSGVVNSASRTLSSGSDVSFTKADVGKHISVAGAGATQFFGTAVIAGGGSGYAVGDTITLAGGTGTAATLTIREVSAGAVTEVSGAPLSLGKYTAVPTNPVAQASSSGAGTGGTFTVSWNNDTLVTTITEVTSANTVVMAQPANRTWSGTLFAYGSDYSAEINAAIATETGPWTLPIGGCGVTSTISFPSGYKRFVGLGTGGYNQALTQLLWLGPVDGTVLKVNTGVRVSGLVIGPMTISGVCAASKIAEMYGLQDSEISLGMNDAKDYGLDQNKSGGSLNDMYNNDFRRLSIAMNDPRCGHSATALHFGIADNANDINNNAYFNLETITRGGIGIDIKQGYMNTFYNPQAYVVGNGWALRLGGSNTAGQQNLSARFNTFFSMLAAGDIISESGTELPASWNLITPLEVTFGSVRRIGEGSILHCTSSRGIPDLCTPYGYSSGYTASITGSSSSVTFTYAGLNRNFKPTVSGRVQLTFTGNMSNTTAGNGGFIAVNYDSTANSTAPVNGDSQIVTATGCGTLVELADTPSATFVVPFTITCALSGLTLGQSYWFDLIFKQAGGAPGTFTPVKIQAQAVETN